MRYGVIFIILFLPFIFLSRYSIAQGHSSDSCMRQNSIDAVIDLYHKKQGTASNLYNGVEVEPYNFIFFQSTPYFKDSSFIQGTVFYDKVKYKDVPLLYDLVHDELILLHFDRVHQINLVKEKVDSFYLSSHHFIKLNPDTSNTVIKGGYYDELYKGQVSLLMKRTKLAEEKIESGSIYLRASAKSSFYLLKEGSYFRIKNKKDLLKMLSDKRNELNHYIRRNKIKFKSMPEIAMTSVVAHYDQLIKK